MLHMVKLQVCKMACCRRLPLHAAYCILLCLHAAHGTGDWLHGVVEDLHGCMLHGVVEDLQVLEAYKARLGRSLGRLGAILGALGPILQPPEGQKAPKIGAQEW